MIWLNVIILLRSISLNVVIQHIIFFLSLWTTIMRPLFRVFFLHFLWVYSSVIKHPQRHKICIIAWMIFKSQIFVNALNQKSDRPVSSYSSSSVSAQRIWLHGRSATRADLDHFQGMDFRRFRYNWSVARFDIFLLLSLPMSESLSCQTTPENMTFS